MNTIQRTFEVNESTLGYKARESQQNIPLNKLAEEFGGIARTFVCKGMMSQATAESYGEKAATAAGGLEVGESVTINVFGSRFGKGLHPNGRMSGDITITRKS